MTRFRFVRTAGLCLLVSALATPAFAQGGYAGVFLVADLLRTDRYDSRAMGSGSGETAGFGLRLGKQVGSIWGVELEFVRSGKITSEESPEVFPVDNRAYTAMAIAGFPGNVRIYDPGLSYPGSTFTYQSTQRLMTFTPAVWVRQEISSKFSLVYVGGVAFGRINRDVTITYPPITVPPVSIPSTPQSMQIPPFVTETVDYRVDPMVGVEGRFRITPKLDLVPSFRMHGLGGGWLMRPAIGLNLNF